MAHRRLPAAAIDGSDVLAVLCGHFHLQLSGRMSQATVWATPGVVTRIDLTAPPHVVRTVHGSSATVIESAVSSHRRSTYYMRGTHTRTRRPTWSTRQPGNPPPKTES